MEKLSTLEPLTFEKIMQTLFQRLGWPGVKMTKKSHDGGVDLQMTRNTVGGQEYGIAQCKRTDVVGVQVARELLGVIASNNSITKCYILTSGQISKECRSFCESNGRLACLSGAEIAKYIVQFDLTKILEDEEA